MNDKTSYERLAFRIAESVAETLPLGVQAEDVLPAIFQSLPQSQAQALEEQELFEKQMREVMGPPPDPKATPIGKLRAALHAEGLTLRETLDAATAKVAEAADEKRRRVQRPCSAAVPYYSDKSCIIYHGKAEDLLPSLAFDILVTDPPYDMGIDRIPIRQEGRAHRYTDSRTVGQKWPVDWGWLDLVFAKEPKHCVVFAGYRDLGDVHSRLGTWGTIGAVFTWRKSNAPVMQRPIPRLDVEFAVWARSKAATCGTMGDFRSCVLDVPMPYAGIGGGERIREFPNGPAAHPCQKPLAVVRPFVERLEAGIICDPFMGTGTTLVAARLTGREAIGIDVEERYCEMAANRLRNEPAKMLF